MKVDNHLICAVKNQINMMSGLLRENRYPAQRDDFKKGIKILKKSLKVLTKKMAAGDEL